MANNINYYNALLGRLFDDGKEMPLRGGLNFVGFDVVPSQYGYDLNLAAEVPASRSVFAGAGLIGGGDLSVDRTINVAPADATIVVAADSIRAGVMGSTNFADGTIALPRLVNAAAAGLIAGRKISGGPQWAECTPAELNLVTNLANTIALANLVNAAAQFQIIGRRTAGGGAWEASTAAQLNLLTTAINSIALATLVNAAAQFSVMGRKTAGAGAWEDCTAAQLQLATTVANTITLANLVNASAQFRVMGRKTAGAGAWQDCAAAELGLLQQFDVKAYGAIGDGVADDTTAINAAKNAAIAAGGGTVFFPRGRYLSGTVVINLATGVYVRGEGSDASVMIPNGAVNCLAFTNSTGVGIIGMGFERTGAVNGGSAAIVTSCQRVQVRNTRIRWITAGMTFDRCSDVVIDDFIAENLIAGGGQGALAFQGTPAVPCQNIMISRVKISNPMVGAGPWVLKTYAGTTPYVVGDTVFVADRYYECTTAGTSAGAGGVLSTGPLPGATAPAAFTGTITDGTAIWRFVTGNNFCIFINSDTRFLYASQVSIEGGVHCLITANSVGGGTEPSDIFVSQFTALRPFWAGINLSAAGKRARFKDVRILTSINDIGFGTSGGSDIRLEDFTIEDCYHAGVLLNGGTDTHLRNGKVLNCARQGASSADGITVAVNVTDFSIIGVVCRGANHNRGVALGTGSENFVIHSNDFSGNASGIFNGSKDTATKMIVRDNIGDDSDVATKYLTGQSASIANTPIATALLPKGTYRLSYYIVCTTTGSGNVGVNFAWTDDRQAQSFTGSTINLNGANFRGESIIIEVGSAGVNFSTTSSASAGTFYSVRVSLERVNHVSP